MATRERKKEIGKNDDTCLGLDTVGDSGGLNVSLTFHIRNGISA